MTREQATQLLPLVEAFIRGEEIQQRANSTCQWSASELHCYNPSCQYRIKPKAREAREWWVGVTKDGDITSTAGGRVETVRVREVL